MSDLENPSFILLLIDGACPTIGTSDLGVLTTSNVIDAIGIPDSSLDVERCQPQSIDGSLNAFPGFKYTGDEPKLVFRDGVTGDWYAINDPPQERIYLLDGSYESVTFFATGDPFSSSFGSTNPSVQTIPTDFPSSSPSIAPSNHPSSLPSEFPSDSPTALPSVAPSKSPSSKPSLSPSPSESTSPSYGPSVAPSRSSIPSRSPSDIPSVAPSGSSVPSQRPSASDPPTSCLLEDQLCDPSLDSCCGETQCLRQVEGERGSSDTAKGSGTRRRLAREGLTSEHGRILRTRAIGKGKGESELGSGDEVYKCTPTINPPYAPSGRGKGSKGSGSSAPSASAVPSASSYGKGSKGSARQPQALLPPRRAARERAAKDGALRMERSRVDRWRHPQTRPMPHAVAPSTWGGHLAPSRVLAIFLGIGCTYFIYVLTFRSSLMYTVSTS